MAKQTNNANIALEIFDDIETDKQKKVKKKGMSKLLLIPLILFLVTYIAYNLSLGIQSNDRLLAEEQFSSMKQEMLSEPHTSMEFYLKNDKTGNAMDATARLVGHVMDTGCSKAYATLRNYYSASYLEPLHDYLTGTECKDYISPRVICLEKRDNLHIFKFILSKNGNAFLITVNHDNNVPVAFKISNYE